MQRPFHDCVATKITKGLNVDEREDSDDDTAAHGVAAPPPYMALSLQFRSLESAATACGNGKCCL